MAEQDYELTPESLRLWELHVAHLERAAAEIERRSQALVSGMRAHYAKPEGVTPPA